MMVTLAGLGRAPWTAQQPVDCSCLLSSHPRNQGKFSRCHSHFCQCKL